MPGIPQNPEAQIPTLTFEISLTVFAGTMACSDIISLLYTNMIMV
jgi:hypothetical protein